MRSVSNLLPLVLVVCFQIVFIMIDFLCFDAIGSSFVFIMSFFLQTLDIKIGRFTKEKTTINLNAPTQKWIKCLVTLFTKLHNTIGLWVYLVNNCLFYSCAQLLLHITLNVLGFSFYLSLSLSVYLVMCNIETV